MNRTFLVIFLFHISLASVACLPLINVESQPIVSEIPTATNTPIPTKVWFPPTATYTPLPASSRLITPTIETNTNYSSKIFSDNFTDPKNWELGTFADGIIAIGNNELTLAVKKERGYLFSIREQTNLSDFYAEISARPSICRGEDEYGFLFRYSSPGDFYRFSITCNGQYRIDRLFEGQASSPQPFTISGAIPPGAPSESRIAVMARDKEMQFFINDEHLTSISDPTLGNGNIGVFVRAAGEDDVTVSYSNLDVYEID
jgi:hypothetical protein